MFTILIENIRLDIAVSKGMNHLLKAPFVIHPKTGRVCVPFRVAKVDSFDPDKVSLFLFLSGSSHSLEFYQVKLFQGTHCFTTC